jgi:hypothetical protein
MSASVVTLPTSYTPGVTLVDAAELDRLREVERLATVLCTEIYDRRARRWYRAPMALVAPLAAALLRGRA